ncbi:MAG TPA: chemotaxis protein CheW [Polyangiaceae bacterium]|nr:chemotaxis protein CheW [Polyangiaceae bacterium]
MTFTLGDGEYGIEILHVQEFKGYTAVTPVPNMPAHLRGVMNLRGIIIPVFDLRVRFGLPATLNEFTVIVVAVINGRTVGLVVDTVSDVIDIDSSAIQQTPEFSARADSAFLKGMAKRGDRLVILLALEQLVSLGGAASTTA